MNYLYIASAVLCLFGANIGLTIAADKVTKCYFCESATTPSCVDPFDNKTFEPVFCSDLKTSDGTVQTRISLGDKITDAFRKEELTRSMEPDYRCLKIVAVEADNKQNLIRTCGIYDPAKKTACSALREILKENKEDVTLSVCEECNDNNCNAAVDLTASFFLAVGALLFGKL